MYVIKAKAKKGGFWDDKKKCIVREISVKDKSTADEYEKKGFIVEEKKDKAEKSEKE